MKGHLFNIYFLLTLGPPLPKALSGISMLEIHGDAYVFGGIDSANNFNSAIYQLTCSSGICSRSTLNKALKVARYQFVSIRVPDDFCLEEEESTTTTTRTKTSTLTPSGCGSPYWANDKWCDDENNNAGCNFDDGACCNNFFNGWNTYCQVTSDYYYC